MSGKSVRPSCDVNDVEVGSAGGEVSEEVQRVRVKRKPE